MNENQEKDNELIDLTYIDKNGNKITVKAKANIDADRAGVIKSVLQIAHWGTAGVSKEKEMSGMETFLIFTSNIYFILCILFAIYSLYYLYSLFNIIKIPNFLIFSFSYLVGFCVAGSCILILQNFSSFATALRNLKKYV